MSLYRVVVLILGLFGAGGVTALAYAGANYIKNEAATAVEPLTSLPSRVVSLEKMAAEREVSVKEHAVWRAKKDEIDTRLTVIVENLAAMAERQQKQIDRQQNLIEEFNRQRGR